MKKNEVGLENIVGGTTITGTVINAITEIIRVLGEAGEDLVHHLED